MEKSPPPGSQEKKVSIEEPKTLTEAELNALREKAREIINTHSVEEATKIFLAGSKNVAGPSIEVKVKPKENVR
ncbi:hypothetical protein ACH5RR_034134 [Cinchona calisaya]|uniref:Uncharacterized protein n=1 Tax=Cinchona calisaya TaxID=153742 RepID=A0ABD2YBC6_9GENT